MELKECILEKYYKEHKRPSIIAKELNISPAYVTKTIQQDSRYTQEKEYRAKKSKEIRKKKKNQWIKNKRYKSADEQLDEYVKLQHFQASRELSYSYNMIYR